ncbi:MAG: DUF971 domain-containing protein [Pseudomonadota bacterium]
MTSTQSSAPPSGLNVGPDRKTLKVKWDETDEGTLTAEELRIWSPSAEVQGHGPGQAVLQTGKRNVAITGVEPVGRYAVRVTFDDGHNTGIYSWSFLRQLTAHRDEMWRDYLEALTDAGASRDG